MKSLFQLAKIPLQREQVFSLAERLDIDGNGFINYRYITFQMHKTLFFSKFKLQKLLQKLIFFCGSYNTIKSV